MRSRFKKIVAMFVAIPLTTMFVARSARAQSESAFDRIEKTWQPYLSEKDPSQFAMKVRALATSSHGLWGGDKDFFFAWAKKTNANWFADSARFIQSHGDVHAGNVGTYDPHLPDGKLAFGLIDFDESAPLPPEIDLMEATISLRLLANERNFGLADEEFAALTRAMMDRYESASQNAANASELLAGNARVSALLHRESVSNSLSNWLDSNGRFRSAITKNGGVKDIMRSAMNRADSLSEAVAHAMSQSSTLKTILKLDSKSDVRSAMKDAVYRTSIGSAGSQGEEKILILLNDQLIYLKQEIPCAPERAGAISPLKATPGERTVAAMNACCSPAPLAVPCEADGKFYVLTIKDSRSQSLGDVWIKSPDDLKTLAEIFGTVLGSAKHVHAPLLCDANDFAAQSKGFVAKLAEESQNFRDDPRVRNLRDEAKNFIDSVSEQSPEKN